MINAQEFLNQLQGAIHLHMAGELGAARALYLRLLPHNPEHPGLRCMLGTVEYQLGDQESAFTHLKKAVTSDPGNPLALNHLGLVLWEKNALIPALQCFELAISRNPDYADAHRHRSVVLRALKRFEEGLAAAQEALRLAPNDVDSLISCANIWFDLLRYDEALEMYQQVLKHRPDAAEIHNSVAVLLRDQHRFSEAQQHWAKAIALRPDYADAHLNLGFLALMQGDFVEGWRRNEWRWQVDSYKKYRRNYTQPLWLGEAPIMGKNIFITAEQGFGDYLQMLRYVPILEAMGANVILEVARPLRSLVEVMPIKAICIDQGSAPPPFDCYCPIMSLPLACHTTLANIPAPIPYLFADAGKRVYWQQKLGKAHRLRVGIVWGSVSDYQRNALRSIGLASCAPLLALPEVEFHCLQKEFQPEDAALLSHFPNLITHAQDLHDFSDTAALIAQMDLVISTCTSVAHLAGAMGKPLWLLLMFAADFRWMLDRADSPWYPTATLLRQKTAGDWAVVISETKRRLCKYRAAV